MVGQMACCRVFPGEQLAAKPHAIGESLGSPARKLFSLVAFAGGVCWVPAVFLRPLLGAVPPRRPLGAIVILAAMRLIDIPIPAAPATLPPRASSGSPLITLFSRAGHGHPL